MASGMSMPRNVRETAAMIYRKAVNKNLIRGRSIEGVVAASLYGACRQCGVPRTLDEIGASSRVGRKEIFEALRAENIGVNVHYIPVHFHPFYQREFGYRKGDYPKAERYYERAITLPIFPKMSDEDIEDVIKAVRKVIAYFSKARLEV